MGEKLLTYWLVSVKTGRIRLFYLLTTQLDYPNGLDQRTCYMAQNMYQ